MGDKGLWLKQKRCHSNGSILIFLNAHSHRLMPSHWYSYNNPAELRRQAELPQLQLLALFLILNACFGFIEQNPADSYVPSASPTASSVTSRAFARKPRRQQHISNTLCWGPLRFERSDVGFIYGNSQIAIIIAWNAHNIHEPIKEYCNWRQNIDINDLLMGNA